VAKVAEPQETVESMPLALLVNPSSGGGRTKEMLPPLENELDERRLEFRVEHTRSVEHGVELALAAAELGELPVVMSGDGLIGAVGGAMAGTGVPMGIVPGGRGNDLARVLGIPTDPAGATAVLAAGQVREIDVGEANGERFLGIASTGFDSECNDLANRTKVVRGNLVYAYSALRTLVSWKPARFTVKVGEESLRYTGYSVAAANSKAFGGGMMLAPDADLTDGQFDVVMIHDVSKWRYARSLPRVFKGTHVDNEEVRIVRASRIELSASRPFALYADGEHLTDLPATLRVLPRALRVVAPPATA
jgi:YegS/Rv2252/BmrU family lipid kinase